MGRLKIISSIYIVIEKGVGESEGEADKMKALNVFFLGLQLLHTRAAQLLVSFTLKDSCLLSSMSLLILMSAVARFHLWGIVTFKNFILCGHAVTCIMNTRSFIKSQKKALAP